MKRHSSVKTQNESSGFWQTPEFAGRLRAERQRLGKNQTDFGNLAGATLDSQSRYENAKHLPNAEYLARLAAQGVDVMYLLTGARSDSAALDPEASDVLTIFLALPAHLRQMATSVLRTMADEAGVIAQPGRAAPPSVTVHEKKDLMRPETRP